MTIRRGNGLGAVVGYTSRRERRKCCIDLLKGPVLRPSTASKLEVSDDADRECRGTEMQRNLDREQLEWKLGEIWLVTGFSVGFHSSLELSTRRRFQYKQSKVKLRLERSALKLKREIGRAHV